MRLAGFTCFFHFPFGLPLTFCLQVYCSSHDPTSASSPCLFSYLQATLHTSLSSWITLCVICGISILHSFRLYASLPLKVAALTLHFMLLHHPYFTNYVKCCTVAYVVDVHAVSLLPRSLLQVRSVCVSDQNKLHCVDDFLRM